MRTHPLTRLLRVAPTTNEIATKGAEMVAGPPSPPWSVRVSHCPTSNGNAVTRAAAMTGSSSATFAIHHHPLPLTADRWALRAARPQAAVGKEAAPIRIW